MDNNDLKQEELRRKRRAANRRNINLSYGIVMAIVIGFLLVDYIILSDIEAFTWRDFLNDIVGNLMGVMGAFVIFDIIHDKLSKDSYADEVSEHILDTLLSQNGIEALDENLKRKFVSASLVSLDSDKEAGAEIADSVEKYLTGNSDREKVLELLDEFSNKKKEEYIYSNVKSIIKDSDSFDMLQNFLDGYLKKNYDCRLRTSFSYEFILSTNLSDVYDCFNNKNDYFLVQEMVTYQIKYLTQEANNLKGKDGEISLGFSYDNKSLDKLLRDGKTDLQEDKECIFRESLCLNAEEIAYFNNLSSDELLDLFQKMFKPHLTIDGDECSLKSVKSNDYGIIAKFKIDEKRIIELEKDIHNVDIVFYMPKLWNGVLEVALVDPTKNPKISINYPEDSMHVDMYSFLNKSDDISYDHTHIEDNGMYRIILNDSWVFPVSGIVFAINRL